MCRYTYHHYPNCGHIAHYTVMSCLEFTNQLRMFASADGIFPEPYHLTCDDIKISHDLLPPDHPDLCLQCSYDWSSTYTQQNNVNHLPQRNRALEGLDATHPIIDLKARMVVQTNPDPNNLHDKQTDMYQNNPNTVGDDGRYHSSGCPAQVGTEQLFMGENTNHTTWGLPASNFGTSCIPGSNILFYPELCACCGFDWDLYEMTEPHAQLDPDFESHQEHTSTDVSFDVRDTNDVFSSFHDFGPLSYMPHVDALPCTTIDDFDDFEPMPGATTDCLAQLDLDCTENSNIDSNIIDLLGALPSHQEIIVELAQAFKTGVSSDENAPETAACFDNTSHTNQEPREFTQATPSLNHSDSWTSLWRANMSSASSPSFRDHNDNADEWFSDLDFVSFGTRANIDTSDALDTPVNHGATTGFLDFLGDEEEEECLPLSW